MGFEVGASAFWCSGKGGGLTGCAAMCQAIMRCSMRIHGGDFLGCWLRAKERERDWGGRGEARLAKRLRAKGGRKGQGEMEMEEPYRDFDPFLSSPKIP